MSRRKIKTKIKTQQKSETTARSDRPYRRCLVKGKSLPKERLLRFVIGPMGEIVPDVENRLPGRGLWLSAARDVVNRARTDRLFAKMVRGKVQVPDDLADRVEMLLIRRCMNLIGLARRNGQLVVGFEKVKMRLRTGIPGVLIAAVDGASTSLTEVRSLAPKVPFFGLLRNEELEATAALGREKAVHMVVASGRLADLLITEEQRLVGFRK